MSKRGATVTGAEVTEHAQPIQASDPTKTPSRHRGAAGGSQLTSSVEQQGAPSQRGVKLITPSKEKGSVGKKRIRRSESYSSYILRILKQIHPKMGISKSSMSIMNSLVQDTFQRIADDAGRLVRYSKKGTLGSREIQTAIRLVLPGELAKHAVSEGTKAVTKFSQA